MKTPNAQYNVLEAGSLPVRIATRMRKRMYQVFLDTTGVRQGESILDVGATSDQSLESSNYLEAWYPHKGSITAVGIDDASFLEELYPGMKFISANGLDLPFPDGSFDFVHSSAVFEHVGSEARQKQFLAELFRVARKSIFVTTPNRWFPVEFHTVLPLVHWLPKRSFRWLMNHTGRSFFGDEKNLNLVEYSDLARLCGELGIGQYRIRRLRLAGWTSNLVLYAKK